MKNRTKRLLAVCCSVVLGASAIVPTAAFADEYTDDERRALFIKDVAKYLTINARYMDVTEESLYEAAILEVAENNPELYEDIMRAMLSSIDEHSEYYNAEEAALFKENVSGEITGIGITFQMCDEGVDVRSVIADTPAAKGGLQVGDIIVSVDDISLAGMNSDTASGYIKGEEGTALKIGIKRAGVDSIIYVELIREKIVGTSVTHKQYTDGDNKLMYIKVYGFVNNTAETFGEALKAADAAGIKNLVIDLRDNGGGIFEQAIAMADMLVPKGSTITTEDHKIQLLNRVYTAQLDDTAEYETVVLINENSASASEVLAAALSENECATIIGETSYGKGTIQTVADLTYGDSIKYTVGYYLTPLGNNIDGVGIKPDLEIKNTTSAFEIEKYQKFRFEKVYQKGDTSDEIANAKALLAAWGTYSGEIDEVYDEALSDAVYDFQAYTGLYPYGVLDLTTQNELYNRMEKSKVVHDDQLDAAFEHFEMTRE